MKKLIYILMVAVLAVSCKKEEDLDLSEYVSESVADANVYIRSISVHNVNDSLRIIYCDEQTQALKYALFTESDCSISFVDKVDTSEKHNANMGIHGYEVVDNREYLVYEEYKSEKKMYFKVINRRLGKPSWTLDLVGADPTEFLTFSHDGNLFIMYTDDHIIVKQYDNGLASVRMSEKISDILHPRLYKQESSDTFWLYCFENNMLSQRNMRISKNDRYQIETTDSVAVAENVKSYCVSLDSENRPYLLVYNENDYTMTLHDPNVGKPQLMGYYSTVYALESIIIDGRIYFVVSSVVPSENNPPSYQLTLIYCDDSGVWREGSLCRMDSPVYQLCLAEYYHKLYMIYGVNSLIMAQVELGF